MKNASMELIGKWEKMWKNGNGVPPFPTFLFRGIGGSGEVHGRIDY